MTNLLTCVPNRYQPAVPAMARTFYQQLSPEEVHTQVDRVIAQLWEHFPKAAEMLEDAIPDILALSAFPVSYRLKFRLNDPPVRLNPNPP